MGTSQFKIGYSEVGGIYIGKNIQSDFHKHYAITVLISFGEPFKITTEDGEQDSYKVAIIQKNINYNLQTGNKDHVIFLHMDPWSDNGLRLSNRNKSIQKLAIGPFAEVLNDFKAWFESSENTMDQVERLLNRASLIPEGTHSQKINMDARIKKSMELIGQMNGDEKLSLHQVASTVNLSESHFAHLFKNETGMTFRKYVLHKKLIRSIFAMYKQKSLTHASFIGGFSDQSHFTRTFVNAFGINPSSTTK